MNFAALASLAPFVPSGVTFHPVRHHDAARIERPLHRYHRLSLNNTSTENVSPATNSCRLACASNGIATSSASARSIRFSTPSISHTATVAPCLASCSRRSRDLFRRGNQRLRRSRAIQVPGQISPQQLIPDRQHSALEPSPPARREIAPPATRAAQPTTARRIFPRRPSRSPPPEIPAAGKMRSRKTRAFPANDAARGLPCPIST